MVNNNEFDKIKTRVPFTHVHVEDVLNFPQRGYYQGFHYNVGENGVDIELSGKMFATPTDFGAITQDNCEQITDIIAEKSGLYIDKDYFLNEAPIYRVDVKKDVAVEGNAPDYLSEMREVFKRDTDRYDVYKYADLSYANGLVIIPKIQAGFRLSMYVKGKELKKSRNKEYREIFDYDFLKQADNTIRCEYQTKKFKDTRETYGIEEGATPTIVQIMSCDTNVVADVMDKFLGEVK